MKLRERYYNILLREDTHSLHAEDSILKGPQYLSKMLKFFKNTLSLLEGDGDSNVPSPTVKIDGAPQLTFQTSFPGFDGQFVSTKSIFNANPKIYQSEEDITADNRPEGLKQKLSVGLKLAQQNIIPPGQIWQGDLLWTKGDAKKSDNFIYVKPNTLAYAAIEGSEIANYMLNKEIGIVFHTRYVGNSLQDIKQSNDIKIEELKNVPNWAYAIDARVPNGSGQLTFDKQETAAAWDIYNEIEPLAQELSKDPQYKEFTDNENFINFYVMTLQNKKVDEQLNIDPEKFIEDLTNWIDARMEKEHKKADALKTEKGKITKHEKINTTTRELKILVDHNKDILLQIARLLNLASELKAELIEKMESASQFITMVEKRSGGMEATSGEGFMISDQDGDFVKLVDRKQFSYFNRSNDIIKGFEHPEEIKESLRFLEEEETEKESEEESFAFDTQEDAEQFIKEQNAELQESLKEGAHQGKKSTKVTTQPIKNGKKDDYDDELNQIYDKYAKSAFASTTPDKQKYIITAKVNKKTGGLTLEKKPELKASPEEKKSATKKIKPQQDKIKNNFFAFSSQSTSTTPEEKAEKARQLLGFKEAKELKELEDLTPEEQKEIIDNEDIFVYYLKGAKKQPAIPKSQLNKLADKLVSLGESNGKDYDRDSIIKTLNPSIDSSKNLSEFGIEMSFIFTGATVGTGADNQGEAWEKELYTYLYAASPNHDWISKNQDKNKTEEVLRAEAENQYKDPSWKAIADSIYANFLDIQQRSIVNQDSNVRIDPKNSSIRMYFTTKNTKLPSTTLKEWQIKSETILNKALQTQKTAELKKQFNDKVIEKITIFKKADIVSSIPVDDGFLYLPISIKEQEDNGNTGDFSLNTWKNIITDDINEDNFAKYDQILKDKLQESLKQVVKGISLKIEKNSKSLLSSDPLESKQEEQERDSERDSLLFIQNELNDNSKSILEIRKILEDLKYHLGQNTLKALVINIVDQINQVATTTVSDINKFEKNPIDGTPYPYYSFFDWIKTKSIRNRGNIQKALKDIIQLYTGSSGAIYAFRDGGSTVKYLFKIPKKLEGQGVVNIQPPLSEKGKPQIEIQFGNLYARFRDGGGKGSYKMDIKDFNNLFETLKQNIAATSTSKKGLVKAHENLNNIFAKVLQRSLKRLG